MSTPTPLKAPSIEAAIRYLYQESEAARPTPFRPVVPLRKLISGCPLNCVELPGLTRASAIAYFSEPSGACDDAHRGDSETLSGFLYTGVRSGTIFINRSEPVVRRRFSIAHELGHFLLHLRPLFKAVKAEGMLVGISDPEIVDADADDRSAVTPPITPQLVGELDTTGLLPPMGEMEKQADEFAAELLLPSACVQELFASTCQGFRAKDLSWRLATDMLVSNAAMERRLRDLKLIS